MSIEENKRIVRTFMERSDLADYEGASALLHDDAKIWISALGLVTKAELLPVWVGKKEFKGPGHSTLGHMTAEDDRVALEWFGDAILENGMRYGGVYHALFFVRDGKIVELREYTDTFYTNSRYPGKMKVRELALRPTSDERYEGSLKS